MPRKNNISGRKANKTLLIRLEKDLEYFRKEFVKDSCSEKNRR